MMNIQNKALSPLMLISLMLNVGVAFSAAPEDQSDEDATRIFFLGNSLTDEVKYDAFLELAGAGGEPIVWSRQMSPGIPITGLWNLKDGGGFTRNPYGAWGKALTEFQWDALTLQPFANQFERELRSAHRFCRILAENSPDATAYVYAQWPNKPERKPGGLVNTRAVDWYLRFAGKQLNYEPKSWAMKGLDPVYAYPNVVEGLPQPLNETFKDRSLKHQYEAMVYALNEFQATKQPVRLIPVGHVIRLLGQKMRAGLVPGYQTPWDLYSDGVHVNNVGSYLVACTFYATIFGKSPVGLPVGPYQGQPGLAADGIHISPELAAIIQETVWEIVATHPLSGVSGNKAVRIASPMLFPAVAGEPYRFDILPAFGTPPYVWSIADGTLPEGLNLAPNGVLSGIATDPGKTNPQVQVSDANGKAARKKLPLVVEPDRSPALPDQRIPDLEVGSFIESHLRSEAGNGTHRWSVKEDSTLPPGLTLDGDGRLWGTPGKSGRFGFTLVVEDADSAKPEQTERAFVVTVGPPTGEVAFARQLKLANSERPPLDESFWQFRYPVNKRVEGDETTVSGAFDVAWNEKSLYVAVKVDDPSINETSWAPTLQADNVILCLDAFNNRETTYNADDRYYPYPRGFKHAQRSIMVGPKMRQRCYQKELPGGYLAVIEIIWKNLELENRIEPGLSIGLDVMIADNAKDGKAASTVVWKGTQNNATDPSQFGTVILKSKQPIKGAP